MYGNEEVDYGDDDSISSSWDDTAQTSDTHLFHGASSEKERESDTVETNTGTHGDDLAFMKNIRAAAQMVTRASGDIDYTGRNPVDTLQRVLGVNMGNPIYKCMAFRCPKGKDLGSSVFAWARSWNVQTHPDGHDYTMVERGKPRSWDYPRVWDKISQATTNCQLDPAPLQLLALCLVAPRAISDQIANGALKDLKDHQTSDLPTNSCLLAWQDVNNKSSPSEIADAFSKFIEGCRRMSPGKVKEQPQPWSRVFAREKKIIEKIAEHSDGTEINWSMRRLLYVELIASSKRWQLKRESLMGCMERIRTSKCPEDVMEILTETAYEAKFTSIDTLLNLKRSSGGPLDTGEQRGAPRARITTGDVSTTNSEVIITPRSRSSSTTDDEVIRRAPRSSFNPPARIKSVAASHGISMNDLMTRMNKKLCIVCGENGHMYMNCRKYEVSAYPEGCCAAINSVNNKLLIEPVRVSIGGSVYIAARCGFDTMASVSVVSETFLTQTLDNTHPQYNPISNHPEPRTVKGLNSSTTLDKVISMDIAFRGYECNQECWVIPEGTSGLPAGLDINIGYPDLMKYGISIQMPKHCIQGKMSFKVLTDLAINQLILQAGIKHPLPGASNYQGLLRPLSSWERKDTKNQRWVYEIHWEMDQEGSARKSHDYSANMFSKLNGMQRDLAEEELSKLLQSGWWWDKDCREPPVRACDAVIIPDDIISFPLTQGQHKSTKVRLCSDARQLNSRIWKASYRGMAVSDCLNTIRGNYLPGNSITFIDLEKAFYKIRLGANRVLRITSNGRHYYTNCVVFGVSFGPSSLGGKVVLLLNAVFTVLLGRDIRMKSVDEASKFFPDVVIVVFYDDICIMGNPMKCKTIISLLCYIAQLVGDSFPEEKRDEIIEGSSPCRHLGVLWSKDLDGRLCLSCVPISDESKFAPEIVSRRDIFSLAGHRYDPLKCHPIARLVADRMRRWAGRSEGGNSRAAWNRKWELSAKQMGILQCLLSLADQDMTDNCTHKCLPPDFTTIVVYSDACGSGFGYSIRIARSDYSVGNLDSWIILEETAEEYGPKERSWHINRKESYPMLCALRRTLYWVRTMRRTIHSVLIYSDNSSAVAWASDKPIKMQLIEHVELERMINSMQAVRDELKNEHGCSIKFSHIKGKANSRADFLSRALSAVPNLDPLGNQTVKKKQKKDDAVVMVVMSPCGELTVSDGAHNHYQGLSRTPLAEVQTQNDASSARNDETLCIITGITDSVTQRTAIDHDDCTNVADLSENEIIQHIQEALLDHQFLKNHQIFNIKLYDILACLGVMKAEEDDVSSAAQAFVSGGAHGKYLRWDDTLNVLLVCDPLEEEPRWRIYLPSKRARHWVVYRYHDHRYLSLHRSLERVLHAVRCPSVGFSFWWDGMTKDITQMIRCCGTCQLNKHHDMINRAPIVYRRWQKRFQKIQLDFAGPFSLTNQNDKTPWDTEYLCLIICECTHMSLAIPTKSTTARDVIGVLLIWFSTYGPAKYIQLDACPAHDSEALRQFTSAWGAELVLGIPRRPESQGLIERLIRDVKTAIRIGTCAPDATLPWWICAFNAISIHNSSPIKDGLGCTPAMLAHSREDLLPETESSDPDSSGLDELCQKNCEYLSSVMQCFLVSRADAALGKEIKTLIDEPLRFKFNAGDSIKVSRLINGRRKVSGPYRISHQHPHNALLFYVEGFDKPFSARQLLPYHTCDERVALDFATLPSRVATAIIGKADMPDGITLDLLKKNDHWIVYKELDESANAEPTLMIYAARFLSFDSSSNSITIQGLDHNTRNNSWVLPPKKERALTVKTISIDSVIGRAGFRPTCRGTVPQRIRNWFADQGCDV